MNAGLQTKRVPFSGMAETVGDVLARGGLVRLRVEGDSMTPWLRGGEDDVILANPAGRSWGRGDIVLAWDGRSRFVLHRVARREEGSIWLRGDAQTVMEGPWPETQVLAVVDRLVRDGSEVPMASLRARLFALVWRARQRLPPGLMHWASSKRRRLRGLLP